MKEKLAQYFKWKLDGSRFYIGRSMVEVHSNLGISDETFDKMLGILTVSLKKMKPNINIKVLKEFVQRIAAIRPQICFPPVVAFDGQPSQIEANFISPGGPDEEDKNKEESHEDKGSLFNQLGQEVGLRNIVENMIEQMNLYGRDVFKKSSENGNRFAEQQIVTKYSMFLASMLDARYEWFYRDLI